jgi:MoaA/NifB/PqqE/SkfB family radical SAM enzyme
MVKNTREDPRIDEYLYWNQLMDHLDHKPERFFDGSLVYPKQFEIHLPANHIRSCVLNCEYCAGKYFDKPLGVWENGALTLLDKIAGRIPQHIYGGSYTEPLMNPYLMAFMAKTRQYGNSFGIHTNGVMLPKLDEATGFLTELNRVAEGDRKSYLQVSLDGATSWGWGKVKRTSKPEAYWAILDYMRKAVEIREKKGSGHSIRMGYLISEHTASPEQFSIIVNMAKDMGIDSLRFSIPFAHYNQSFDDVRQYKENVEVPREKLYEEWLAPLVSKSKDEKPYIFWNYPWFTDIDRFEFDQCVYTYFQITLAADGWFYPCSTVSTPTAGHLRIAPFTDNIDEFEKILIRAQDSRFNAKKACFDKGLRCNRMGLECNTAYKEILDR